MTFLSFSLQILTLCSLIAEFPNKKRKQPNKHHTIKIIGRERSLKQQKKTYDTEQKIAIKCEM